MDFLDKILRGSTKSVTDDVFTLALEERFPLHRKGVGDGIKIESTPMGIFVCMFYVNPTRQEIANIEGGDISLFFAFLKPVLECAIQLNDDFAGDATYYAPLYNEDMPESELNPRRIFVCLVDSESYILKAMRIIELKSKVAKFLSTVLHLQMELPQLSDEEYDEAVNIIQQNFTPQDIAVTSEATVVILRNNSITELAKEFE